jgi:translation initiation factor 5B
MKIRQPIISVMAHVDHGKTSLLDYIRGGSLVTSKEEGGITQHIGATEIPLDKIKKICSKTSLTINFKIPGLLFIDTPGHEAFNLLRERGGSLADIAVVVIDVTEGCKPQTDEVLSILKNQKTPFIVAANKVDKLSGWINQKDECILSSLSKQRSDIVEKLDLKIYELIGQLYERGFNSDRFDRINDFTKQISIIPICALSGEGVAELLSVLAGLTQKYMEKKLEINPDGIGKGTILEIKEVKGLGTTADVILYDGTAKKGDTILIGNPGGLVKTKVRALLKTEPEKEIRVEKAFTNIDEVVAASGVKIVAPDLENIVPGVAIEFIHQENQLNDSIERISKNIQNLEIETDSEGVIIRADAIGSLEALVSMLKDKGVPIRKAKIGNVTKKDAIQLKNSSDENRIIFMFNTKINSDAKKELDTINVKIFRSGVVYHLLEEYDEYIKVIQENKKREVLESIPRVAQIRLIPGYIFRQSNPAIGGFEIVDGILQKDLRLMNKDGKIIGSIHSLEEKGKNVKEAQKGSQVAVSIVGPTIGRNLKENDMLFTYLTKDQFKKLVQNKHLLKNHELNVLEEIKQIMIKVDPMFIYG